MRDEVAIGIIVGAVLIIGIIGAMLTVDADATGNFAVKPARYGGAIESVEPKGFVGRAFATDRNDCYKCTVDDDHFGYSAENLKNAQKACDEKGGSVSLWHEGSCTESESL